MQNTRTNTQINLIVLVPKISEKIEIEIMDGWMETPYLQEKTFSAVLFG